VSEEEEEEEEDMEIMSFSTLVLVAVRVLNVYWCCVSCVYDGKQRDHQVV